MRLYQNCTKTDRIEAVGVLGLAMSEKQIPQIVENNQSGTERMEPLEGTGVRPRQMRYQVVRCFASTAGAGRGSPDARAFLVPNPRKSAARKPVGRFGRYTTKWAVP